jgi:O-antigen/teichoic acid export membrane protein
MVWSNEIARRMLSYGTQIIGIEVLSVVWATADYVIIARWLSDADLGLYQQSFRVSDLLIISLCFAAGRVLFPSFAKVNDDLERLQSSFLVALRYIALLALPMSIGLFVVAPLFVAAVFGENWLPMIPVLQWLALRAGIHAISFNTGHVLKATGRPDIVTKQMLVKLGVLVPVVLLTVRYGIVAVALGQVGVAIFSALVEFGTIIVVLGVPVKRIWQQIQSPLLASFGMGGMVWFVMLYFPEGLPSLALAGSVITGFAAYAALLLLFERQFVIDSVRSGVRLLRPHSPTTVK